MESSVSRLIENVMLREETENDILDLLIKQIHDYENQCKKKPECCLITHEAWKKVLKSLPDKRSKVITRKKYRGKSVVSILGVPFVNGGNYISWSEYAGGTNNL